MSKELECCDRMTHTKRDKNTCTASSGQFASRINEALLSTPFRTEANVVFFAHIKVSTMRKQSVVKVDSFEVHSSSRLRSNSLPALTQRFMSTLSLPTHHHSGSSSSSSSPRTRSHAQTKSHIRSFSNSLRSLFAGRKPRRNSTESADDSETEEESLGDIIDLFPSCPSTLPQWKGHDHTALRSNDPISLLAGAFDVDEDTSEPEEEHVLLIQELVLGRMDLL
ncbi:hypothetical protein CPB85DRAFT_1260419 [Mucidula mucida]|nr:hypothetical protein CPB85DRAFT_1260419 [Mucidula mucida]